MRDSKITFRVSDDLLERVDDIEESRSEIMREALRSYLEGPSPEATREEPEGKTQTQKQGHGHTTLDGVLRAMIRETVNDVVDEAVEKRLRGRERDNVNVTVNVPDTQTAEADGRQASDQGTREPRGKERGTGRGQGQGTRDAPTSDTPEAAGTTNDDTKACHQCGEEVADEHVHCPNCGAKTSQRLFCDCGDEIRSDWSFCPTCGRRTPTSHALSKE